MSLQVDRKVNSKDSTQKYMVLKNVKFDVKKEDFTIEKIDYKRYSGYQNE